MTLNRNITMLVVAIITGLFAVFLAARWMQQRASAVGKVAVAAVDIPVGGRITGSMIQMVDWPAGSVPEGVYSDAQALDGRVTRTGLLHGEPIFAGKLAPVGAHGGLSSVVVEGKRAITVRVNDVVGVAGFALPGSFVDVMVNTQEGGARNGDKDRAISKIVLERILVLAAAQQSDRDETKPKVVNAVTLEVTPDEAEKLDLARSVGTLSLVLRNETDPNPVGTHGATKDSLLGLATIRTPNEPDLRPAPVRVSAARPAVALAPASIAQVRSTNCVEMIRGGVKVTECF